MALLILRLSNFCISKFRVVEKFLDSVSEVYDQIVYFTAVLVQDMQHTKMGAQ